MSIKNFFYTMSNSSTKMLEVYIKNSSEANKKNVFNMAFCKISNIYNRYGWDVEGKGKEKITKQIKILNHLVDINTDKSKNSDSSHLLHVKSEHKLDMLAAYYDHSNKKITAESMMNFLLGSIYNRDIHVSSANINFSGSDLSNTVVETSNNIPLLRADFSDANAENTEINIPVKIDVDYNFTNTNLKNATIKLDIQYDNLSDTVMSSLFGNDDFPYKSVFSSISTIDNKYIEVKQAAFKELAKAYDRRKDYFKSNALVGDEFLNQYMNIKSRSNKIK
ncbi:hypothetical protein JEP98_10670 [Providencia rettgeri]|uniref:hypothetical protein n=1 Tax=Providencia rettgeri TaxID=587 RepID=UPI0018E441E0|nr:hypothetical protein [Providencia rettgeri]MBI6189619.1 hypothetical protein [Providencia rettgeri]